MEQLDVTNLKHEKDFEKIYYETTDPQKRIELLAHWRQHQININPKFVKQIALIANEQYSDIDHFILELLQNADDNIYSENTPTVKISLHNDRFELFNNENGFTAENLFAITYSAASTKLRDKTAASFIGEKGIGFKSVFSVAAQVNIHSSPYHFSLKNDEFIIPRIIEPVNKSGTTIIIKFKENDKIPKILSNSLNSFVINAQEFTLFLQKIEKLEIADNLSKQKRLVEIIRDKEKGYYIVQSEEQEIEYITKSYKIIIHKNIVNKRFKEIDSDLEREIIFAVPILETKIDSIDGKIFCYLPTKVNLSLPIHIQIDAKTLTNRENIAPFDDSEWNKEIFSNLVEQMCDMYVLLTKEEKINKNLPLYLPYKIEEKEIINKDIHNILTQVKSRLESKPIFLDQHGNFKIKDDLWLLPNGFEIFDEGKYEQALNEEFVNEGRRLTFISNEWSKKFRDILKYYEVDEFQNNHIIILLKAGPPERIEIKNENQVRNFLELIMDITERERLEYDKISECPIFPVIINNKRTWSAIDDDTFLVKSDSQLKNISDSIKIIDPLFTYSPGGGTSNKSETDNIRAFNKRFRDFLSETIGIVQYSVEELHKRTTIKDLQNADINIAGTNERKKIESLWFELYKDIWKRKKTIIKTEDDAYWLDLMHQMSSCKIPTQNPSTKLWELEEVKLSFVGPEFKTKINLLKIYSQTNAPIIRFNFLKEILNKKKAKRSIKIDWEDWKQFLLECGAKEGAYFVNEDLTSNHNYYYSGSEVYKDKSNIFAQGIMNAINEHPEYKNSGYQTFSLQNNSKSISLDKHSFELQNNEVDDYLAKRISIIWDDLSDGMTQIYFKWGSIHYSRRIYCNQLYIYQQLHNGLLLKSNIGYKNSTSCFESNPTNIEILSGIAPLVDVEKNNYERNLLKRIGFREKIEVEDIQLLIYSWYSGEKERSFSKFKPYLIAVIQYCKIFQNKTNQIKLAKIFYSDKKDKLLPFSKWIENLQESELSTELVNNIKDILNAHVPHTYNEIINFIFEQNNLNDNIDEIFEGLLELSKYIYSNNLEEIISDFINKLKTIGFIYNNTKITSIGNLPIIWNRAPIINAEGFIVINPKYWRNEELERLITSIGWETLIGNNIEIQSDREKKLKEGEIERVYYVLNEILTPLDNDQHSITIRNLKLFNSIDVIKNNIFKCDKIILTFYRNKQIIKNEVPYWFERNKLIIKSSLKLDTILPQFIDLECNTTLRSTFKYVWNDPDLLKKIESKSKKNGEDTNITGDNFFNTDADKNKKNEKDDKYTNKFNNSGLDKEEEFENDKTPSGPRKRLYSYVNLESGENIEIDNSTNKTKHNKEIEEAGVKIFKEFFEKRSISIKSVEAEDVGYDFEVELGNIIYFVEVKSSRDAWENWEESLTPNEFRKAQHFREKYLLCVIDNVLNENHNIYFIQDPVGKIDSFLFDAPWKEIAMDLTYFQNH